MKVYWIDKLKEHYGNKSFTIYEAIDTIGYNRHCGFTTNEMTGRLRVSDCFEVVGYREVFMSPYKPRHKAQLWRAKSEGD